MRRVSIVLASLILIVGCSSSQVSQPFFADAPSDLAAVLPAPPARGSQEGQAELDTILRLQQTRSAEDVSRVKAEEDYNVFAFATVLGPHFNAAECPKSAALFTRVVNAVKPVSTVAKQQWRRDRPTTDPRVHSLVSEKSFSYPSGHSTRATVYAELLARAVPAKRDELIERGQQIGWDRVIAGIHFPTDIYGGRVLGHAIARSMLRDPVLAADLNEAAKEIGRVCGIKEPTTMPAMMH